MMFKINMNTMGEIKALPAMIELDAIAKHLKELRKSKGYKNYEHIAYELSMSRSAYWRLESGANFELKTLIKICRLLKVSLAEFFADIKLP